jgi:hypothetical protein
MSFMQPSTLRSAALASDRCPALKSPNVPGGRLAAASSLGDDAPGEVVELTKFAHAEVGFEDGEQGPGVGEQQALAALEPQQVGVPVGV